MNYLPDFIIPGAAKAGSTSLASYLKQHPDIFMPPGTAEIHFFNDKESGSSNFSKGIIWYKNHFSNAKPNQIKGEKTPRYSELYVPKRMFKYLPDIKLIWIFRNPVDRAYSHYKMYLWSGTETLSFEEAINKEKNYQNKKFYGYTDFGKYSLHIKEYLKYYNKERMFFIIFEEFIKNPNKILNDVTDFLEIERHGNYIPEHKLVAKHPKSVKYQAFIRKAIYGQLHSYWSGIRPSRFREPIFNFLTTWNKQPRNKIPKIENETKEYLKNLYEPYNQELEKIIGKDLSIWNK